MATSIGIICGVCDTQHKNTCADYWCPECNNGLCTECQKYHSIFQTAHACIPVDQYNKLPLSITEINLHCKDHGDKFTNYCSHHDILCCPDCMSTTHGECKGFLSVKEILKTAKTSALLDNMEQSLAYIENNIANVIQNREQNISNIGQQRKKFHDDIKKLRKKINSFLDSLEQNLLSELNDAEKKLQTNIKNLIDCLTRERESVHTLQINIQTLKEHASDLQTFIGSKKFQHEVEKAEKYMESLSEDGSLAQLELKCKTNDSILETLRTLTLGSVSIETGPPLLVLKTEKDKQAQMMAVLPQQSPKSINDIRLSLFNTSNIPKPGKNGYRGCIIHSNGKMILTNRDNCKLIVLDDDGSICKDIPCSSVVFDLATVDDETVAVSTANGIKIVNICSKQIKQVIKTTDFCYGITYHKGILLFCESYKGLQKMDLSDWSISTLVKQDRLPDSSYITTYGDKLYQTNHTADTVTCFTAKGEECWKYHNPKVIKNPIGITVDNNGNIYTTTNNLNGVAVISPDGKDGKQLLNNIDGLNLPWGICFEKTKNNLLIVNQQGPLLIYDVS